MRQELEVVFDDIGWISFWAILAMEEAIQRIEGSSEVRNRSNYSLHDCLSSLDLTEVHKKLICVRQEHTQSTWTSTTTRLERDSLSVKILEDFDCELMSDKSRRLL